MKTSTSVPSSMSVPTRWSWHHQQLQSIRDRLLEHHDIQIAEVSEPLEPHSMDMADSATDEFDHDMALGILSQEQDALCEVDAAIRRILDGKYGICEETGRLIPAARLRAVPWARHTQEVAERLEQEGCVSHARLGAVSSIQTSGPPGLLKTEDPEDEDMLAREVAATESPLT